MKFTIVLVFFVTSFLSAFCQKKAVLISSDGRLVFSLTVANKNPVYTLFFRGKSVLENSEIQFSFDNRPALLTRMLKARYRNGTDDYQLLVGKSQNVHAEYKEMVVPLEDETGKTHVDFVVRLFSDGAAFRYEFTKVAGADSLTLTEEKTVYRFHGNPMINALPLPNYTSSHEGTYLRTRADEVVNGQLMDMPALVELPGPAFVGITEAALIDHAGLYLTKENGVLRGILSPWPGQSLLKVKASLPHKSPWRVLLVGDRVGALIESNIITSLNEPSPISDWSWLKPGKTTFPWWNGNVLPDTINAPGNNFVTQKYYIDFCARNGIAYHSVVEYGLHQWYVDDGIGFSPGPHSDVTRAVPGLDMKEVCDYARSKGVGVRVWVHWGALYPKLDQAFENFEKWGLQGMMIDFMDRDDQPMVNMQNEMLRKAAAHHLHVQFHGAYKPTGIHRTYPNEFTREGTLNYEINKWDPKGLSPDQDIMIPFTRMLAGSTDYHLGGFRAVPQNQFITQYTRPLMLGTRAHMLAQYVVLENYQGMVCDYPAAYEGQPGFDFICTVPTVWDETRVLDGKVGEYIIIARRHGNEWYVGAINNHELRTVAIPLNFISMKGAASIYADASDVTTQPNHLAESTRQVTASDVITITMGAGGGVAIKIKALK